MPGAHGIPAQSSCVGSPERGDLGWTFVGLGLLVTAGGRGSLDHCPEPEPAGQTGRTRDEGPLRQQAQGPRPCAVAVPHGLAKPQMRRASTTKSCSQRATLPTAFALFVTV